MATSFNAQAHHHHSHSHSSDSGSFRALSKHEQYFINGGDLYFLVEHVHFRVHRYFFERESPFFQSRLMVPASPGATRQGTTESTAIVLDEKSEDFAKFLWVFYNPRYSLYKTSAADWKTILRLAHQWQFSEVQALVVRELEQLPLPDVDRIATYHRYGVDRRLLVPRYAALCAREEPLSLHEGLDLGMETTLQIARGRELARGRVVSPGGARSPVRAGVDEEEMRGLVRALFEIEEPEVEVEPEVESEKGKGKVRVNGAHGHTEADGSGGGAGATTPPDTQATVVGSSANGKAGAGAGANGQHASGASPETNQTPAPGAAQNPGPGPGAPAGGAGAPRNGEEKQKGQGTAAAAVAGGGGGTGNSNVGEDSDDALRASTPNGTRGRGNNKRGRK